MATLVDPDRQNRLVLAAIAILGAALCVAGWIRYLR